MELEDLNHFRTIAELAAQRDAVDTRLNAIAAEFKGLPMSDEAQSEFDALKDYRAEIVTRVTELEARETYLASLAEDEGRNERPGTALPTTRTPRSGPASRLPDNVHDLWAYNGLARSPEDYQALVIDGARKVIDGADFPHPDADPDAMRSHLTKLLARVDDPQALARRIIQTGSPLYGRAFASGLKNALVGGGLSSQEHEVLKLGAAMELGTDSEGGFAVPFQLDPTLIPTSDGVINPLRSVARVERITGKEWSGVTAGAVTVARVGEEDPVTQDGTPALGETPVRTTKVVGFIPISIELQLAWSGILGAIAPLLQDAKDEEEASSFVNGTGDGETGPQGIVAGLAPSSHVYTGAVDFDPDDVYNVKNALPPRFRARGSWMAEGGIYDLVRQFDSNGGSNMWVQLADATPGRLIGYPARELSTMDGVLEQDADILLIGDFRHFVIVDRIGLTMELIPHLFRQATAGAGVGMPTGQRGIYAHWHNSSRILVHNAFRLLRAGVAAS